MSLSLLRKRSFVGIDLGHASIKAMQVEPVSGGWRVAKSGSVPTPPDSILDGVVVNPEAMAEGVRHLLRNERISATSAVLAVAGASVIVRTVRVPKMADATLRKSIRFEAGRYVPSSVEDSFIEFEILGDTGDGNMDVLVAAAPKEVVDSRVRACSLAGVEVEIVDIEAFATYRTLIEAGVDGVKADETLAIIDIGATKTSVSVISKGFFAMTRAIPHAGQTLTEALKSYFRLSQEEAEQGKAQLDLRRLLKDEVPAENPPLRILQPHVDELVREIRRSLNYYQSQQTEQGKPNPVSRIVLAGGGAKLQGLAEYFSQRLGIPTRAQGVFDNRRFAPSSHQAPDHGLDLTVVAGLAIRPTMRAA